MLYDYYKENAGTLVILYIDSSLGLLYCTPPCMTFSFFFCRFFGEMWRPRFGTFRVFLEKKFGKKSVFFLEKSEKKVEEKKKDWQKNW